MMVNFLLASFRRNSVRRRRNTVTEQECLAVVKVIDHFAVYLWGRPFTVVTDHCVLQYLDSSRHLNSRLTRWALQLQQHSFTTTYPPGKRHGNADGLSRQTWTDGEGSDRENLDGCEQGRVTSILTRMPASEEGGDVRTPGGLT